MNVEFEAALRYIDLGANDEAINSLNKAIEAEEAAGNKSIAIEYRCVLGELCLNLGMTREARTEFEKVIEFCNENGTNAKQNKIAKTFLDVMDGKIKPQKQQGPKREESPLVPKPVQNKAFISRQMNRKHR